MNSSVSIPIENHANKISIAKNLLILLFITISLTVGITIYYALDLTTDQPIDVPIDTDIDWNKPPCTPDDLSENWKEVTHPKMQARSQRREFLYMDTNIRIAFEKGISGETGFAKEDHWHRYNPNSVNKRDLYLDRNGNPTGKNSDPSHIKPNCK